MKLKITVDGITIIKKCFTYSYSIICYSGEIREIKLFDKNLNLKHHYKGIITFEELKKKKKEQKLNTYEVTFSNNEKIKINAESYFIDRLNPLVYFTLKNEVIKTFLKVINVEKL